MRVRARVVGVAVAVTSMVAASLAIAVSTNAAGAAVGTVTTVARRINPIGRPLSDLGEYAERIAEVIGIDSTGAIYFRYPKAVVKATVGGTLSLVTSEDIYQGTGLAVDPAGRLYRAPGYSVERREANGTWTTIASVAPSGSLLGSPVFDPSGTVFVMYANGFHRVTNEGTLAGVALGTHGGDSGDGGPVTAASSYVWGSPAVDAAGRVVFAQMDLQRSAVSGVAVTRLRRVDTDGVIRTAYAAPEGKGISSFKVAPDGTMFVSLGGYTGFQSILQIWRVALDGTSTLVAGTGEAGRSPDGTLATAASLGAEVVSVTGLLPNGSVLFTDHGRLVSSSAGPTRGGLLRRFSIGGSLSTVTGAGNLRMSPSTSAVAVAGSNLLVTSPSMEAVAGSGITVSPHGVTYRADDPAQSYQARDIDGDVHVFEPTGQFGFESVERTVRANGTVTSSDVQAINPQGTLRSPAYAADGTFFYISNCQLMRRSPGGEPTPIAFTNCFWTLAYNYPVAVSSTGRVVVGQYGQQLVEVAADGTVTNLTATGGITGNTCSNDGIPAIDTCVVAVGGITFDGAGNLYFSDYTRVRKITPGGTISTVAIGLPEPDTTPQRPMSLAFDPEGNLYVATVDAIRRVEPRRRHGNTFAAECTTFAVSERQW